MRSLTGRGLLLLASIAFGTPSFSAGCPSATWATGQQLTVDSSFRGLAPIDFDGDGVLDLAGALYGPPSSIVTLKGNGDGTFAAPVTLFSGSAQSTGLIGQLSAADIDADGDTDLVAQYGGNLLIFHGTGSGLAAPINSERHYYNVRSFELLNRDADPQLEIIESGSDRIALSDFANGTYTWGFPAITTQEFVRDVTMADFDSDGRLDVASTRATGTDAAGVVEIRFATAGGPWSDPVSLPTGTNPDNLVAGDFNHDGRPDLAVANWTDTTITIYRNVDGTGPFVATSLSARYPERYGSLATLEARDVTGDGILDLVAGTANGGWVGTWAGHGNGTFRTPSWFLGTDHVMAVALADFDEDGDLELAYGGYGKLIIASRVCAAQATLTPEAVLVSSTFEPTLNVAISGFHSTTPQPYGTVTLKKRAATMGTSNVNANGKASFIVPAMPAGEHVFTAEFSGNGELSAAISNSVTQQVTNETTETSLSVPATAPSYGTPWPIDVNVTGASLHGGHAQVKLYIDGVPRDHYNYYLFNAYLTPGEHTIYAKYLGHASSPASTSATLTVTATKATPVFTIGGTAPVRAGQWHPLQITLTGPAGAFAPTGTVQIFSGATLLTNLALTNGAASTNLTFSRGAHAIRAVYSGDDYYFGAELTPTLHVLPNEPVAIEARGLANGIHIAHVEPAGVTNRNLWRRVAGAPAWQLAAWNTTTGMDEGATQRGVVYEYYLDVTGPNGIEGQSAVDAAMLFDDDPIGSGTTPVRRLHITQLRDALNLMRAKAGLAPFTFDVAFETSSVIRAQHLLSLQNAAAQARAALGMAPATFDSFTSGSIISATHLRQTRDAIR